MKKTVKKQPTSHLKNKNKYQMELSQLTKGFDELRAERYNFEIEKQNYQQAIANQHQSLRNVIESNEKILKSNEVFLYSIKENTINTLKDYNKLERILGKFLMFQDMDHKAMWGTMLEVQGKIREMEDYFQKTFKMSPEQYRATRVVKEKDFTQN